MFRAPTDLGRITWGTWIQKCLQIECEWTPKNWSCCLDGRKSLCSYKRPMDRWQTFERLNEMLIKCSLKEMLSKFGICSQNARLKGPAAFAEILGASNVFYDIFFFLNLNKSKLPNLDLYLEIEFLNLQQRTDQNLRNQLFFGSTGNVVVDYLTRAIVSGLFKDISLHVFEDRFPRFLIHSQAKKFDSCDECAVLDQGVSLGPTTHLPRPECYVESHDLHLTYVRFCCFQMRFQKRH